MTTSDLLYRLIEFFFNSLWHFIGLLILLSFLKGTTKNIAHTIRVFFTGVSLRYKRITERQKPPKSIVNPLQQYKPKDKSNPPSSIMGV